MISQPKIYSWTFKEGERDRDRKFYQDRYTSDIEWNLPKADTINAKIYVHLTKDNCPSYRTVRYITYPS